MKTKIFTMVAIIMMVTATIGVGGAFAQEEGLRKEIRGKRLIHRYNVVYRHAEQTRIGMAAVISYVDELGNDSAKLSEIKDSFVTKIEDLKTASDNNNFEDFQQALKDMRDLIKEFREESHNLLGEQVGAARTRVAQAIQDNKEYLDSLIDEINSARGELELEAVDEAVDTAEERTGKAEERGVDTNEVQTKIDEIKQKREELKTKIDAAVASCDETALTVCDTSEAQEYKELRQEIKDDFKSLKEIARNTGRKNRVSKGIESSQRILEKAQERVSKSEERGRDVTTINAKLDEVETSIKSTQNKLDAQDYEGAVEELKAARTAFVSAMKDLRGQVKTEGQGRISERRKGPSAEKGQSTETPAEGGE